MVTVTPNKLFFPLPLDKFIMNTLNVVNVTESHVAFKMKATAPSRYAVKPRQVHHSPRTIPTDDGCFYGDTATEMISA